MRKRGIITGPGEIAGGYKKSPRVSDLRIGYSNGHVATISTPQQDGTSMMSSLFSRFPTFGHRQTGGGGGSRLACQGRLDVVPSNQTRV